MKILTVAEFEFQLQTAAESVFHAFELRILEKNLFRLKARIVLSESVFIDIFFGHGRQRVDFALIREGKRVYGIDNLGDWHRHPLNSEKEHVSMSPLSVQDILADVQKTLGIINDP